MTLNPSDVYVTVVPFLNLIVVLFPLALRHRLYLVSPQRDPLPETLQAREALPQIVPRVGVMQIFARAPDPASLRVITSSITPGCNEHSPRRFVKRNDLTDFVTVQPGNESSSESVRGLWVKPRVG